MTPHAADGPEVELPEISEGSVATLVARTAGPPPDGSSTLEEVADLDVLTRAADALVGQYVVAVAHASTTTGYVLGPGGEEDLIDSLGQRCGLPVVSASAAAVHALRGCGAERVTVAHPPWFDDEMDALGAAYFARAGLEARVVTVTGVPGDPASVTTGDLAGRIAPLVTDESDAVFIAGTGFRAAGAIEEIERRTGRLVVQANQALLWAILRAIGTSRPFRGFGRLLEGVEEGRP